MFVRRSFPRALLAATLAVLPGQRAAAQSPPSAAQVARIQRLLGNARLPAASTGLVATIQRHTAAELMARFAATPAGATRLAEAHRIASGALVSTSSVAAKANDHPISHGAMQTGTPQSGTQSTSPSTSSSSSSSSASSAPLDVTMNPWQGMSATTASGGTSVQTSLFFIATLGGVIPGMAQYWALAPAVSSSGSATVILSATSLTPGWYLVAFESMVDPSSGAANAVVTHGPFDGTPVVQAADCSSAVLAQKDSRGVSTCMALVQVQQSGTHGFDFTVTSGAVLFLDAAISRVNP